jgi:HK97 gp10 family phage protein
MPIEGFEELEAALRELGDAKAIKRTIKAALLEAAEPTAKMARSLAARKTGDLAEGVDVSTTLSRRQKSGRGGHVRARGRFDPFAAFVYIGAHPMGPAVLAEFGTQKRQTKTGKSTGAMPAKPFMRPAWEANKMQILRDFQKYLWVTIEMEAKRIARRQARLLAKGPKK